MATIFLVLINVSGRWMNSDSISVWFKLAPVFSGIVIIGNSNASFAFLSYSGTGISRMSIYQMMTSIF